MKTVEKQKCLECEYLKRDEEAEMLVCSLLEKLEYTLVHSFVSYTRWEITGSTELRFCPKNTIQDSFKVNISASRPDSSAEFINGSRRLRVRKKKSFV
jgi:hypothetical protein